ncbi:hypothetical protein BST45_03650 [Mycobacterium shinjukuense]|nr:hypothetical protein BST45_03650 [Mycobacterium shinjukuense]
MGDTIESGTQVTKISTVATKPAAGHTQTTDEQVTQVVELADSTGDYTATSNQAKVVPLLNATAVTSDPRRG